MDILEPTRANGTFDVKLGPLAAHDDTLGRMSIDKTFKGGLVATSKGEMLAASSASHKNSAGYVAMERVTGTLHDKEGTFVLQHSGTMNRGEGTLVCTVVPDSGTGELTGLSGSLQIIIEGKRHFYEFDYTISSTP